MVLLPTLILLGSAALCLGLGPIVPTRIVGVVATIGTILAAIALALTHWYPIGDPSAMLFSWIAQEEVQVPVRFSLEPSLEPLALVLMGGGGLSFFALSLSLAPSARGFGGFFALALLAMVAVLAALASNGILIAFLWILAMLFSYSAVWASGAYLHHEHISWGMVSGLLAGLLCMGSLLMMGPMAPHTLPAPGGIMGGGGEIGNSTIIAPGVLILACLVLVGSAPFHATFDELIEAPAALGGLFVGLVFPILALGTLLRFATPIGMFLDASLFASALSGQTLLTLVAGGGMVICAIGALQETRLRALLGWQMSGQAAAVLLAIGNGNAAVASFLLMTLALTTLVGAIAIEILEQLTGGNDFAQEFPERYRNPRALRSAGILWALSAIGALGLPPSGSFWARMWLMETVNEHVPWGVPFLLVSGGIAALAFLSPLARFWLGGLGILRPTGDAPGGDVGLANRYAHLVFLLPLIPLVIAGVAPWLVWQYWLQDIPIIATMPAIPIPTAMLPIPNTLQMGYVVLSSVLLLALLAVWYLPRKQQTLSDPDMTMVVLAPRTLAQKLYPLAWLGKPTSLVRASWEGLMWLSSIVQLLLSPFERRYYLSGVMLVLVSLIVLMALQ